jgi:hypothetical protein
MKQEFEDSFRRFRDGAAVLLALHKPHGHECKLPHGEANVKLALKNLVRLKEQIIEREAEIQADYLVMEEQLNSVLACTYGIDDLVGAGFEEAHPDE